ncbi:hypothetical protein MTO96_007697 [Rhipicephalus appendiculatus]
MALFRREASKQQWTRRGVMTVLLVLAAISKVNAQSASGDFKLSGTATGPWSLEVVASVPEHTNGTLDTCTGTLSGPLNELNFTSDNRGVNSSTKTFKGLHAGTEYNCTVTCTIFLADGGVAGATKSILLTTKSELLVPDPSAETGSNRTETGAGMVFTPTPMMVILSTSALFVAGTLSQLLH